MNTEKFMLKAKEIYCNESMEDFKGSKGVDYKGKEWLYFTYRIDDKNIIVVKIFVGTMKKAIEIEHYGKEV